MPGRSVHGRPRLVAAVSLVGFALTLLIALRAGEQTDADAVALWVALALSAVLANLVSANWNGPVLVSGSFVAVGLAMAFVGPLAALSVVCLSEVAFWATDRYRPAALAVNLFGTGAPAVAAALAFQTSAPEEGFIYYATLSLAAGLLIALNFVLVSSLSAVLHGDRLRQRLSGAQEIAPALSINVVLTVAAAGIYRSVGLGAVVFVLVSIFAFTYMARLVVTARERARQYAALSWGVLSGLIRTLDKRDARAARHAAATAAFARDIAEAVGMSARDQELAHTAGLLHDIGRFGLSDRVMERGRTLTEQDWDTIRKHPEMGADLLRDLGVYGPVAEIVKAHHERLDGRGYPMGLSADEIPEIAKIVAVAEVYDTLTADDTYRTPVSSFEALNELRRVCGTQLEGRYVEVLAELLAGRSTDYRHADRADFDTELDVERRIGEAAVGTSPSAADDASGRST